MGYAIELNETLNGINITNNGVVIESFSDIKKAYARIKELEFRNYLEEHKGRVFLYEYSKTRFELGLTNDGWYMTCIDYKNGQTVSCTQYYKNGVLPYEKSYTLLSKTNEIEIIEKTLIEKEEQLIKLTKIGKKEMIEQVNRELYHLRLKKGELEK